MNQRTDTEQADFTAQLAGKRVVGAKQDYTSLLIEFDDGTRLEAYGGCAQSESFFEVEIGRGDRAE